MKISDMMCFIGFIYLMQYVEILILDVFLFFILHVLKLSLSLITSNTIVQGFVCINVIRFDK